MQKKQKRMLVALFVLILLVAIFTDVLSKTLQSNNEIIRGNLGEEGKQVSLRFYIDGTEDAYEYQLEVPSRLATREEAEAFFREAILQMEKDFAQPGDSVPCKESYCDGIVTCQWSFYPWGYIREDGTILWDKFKNEEELISADVRMECGQYEQIHRFAFELQKPMQTKEEKVYIALEQWMKQEAKQEGVSTFHLPESADGSVLSWEERKENATGKVLLLEVAALLGLWFGKRKSDEGKKKKLRLQMEGVYPEVVSKLTLLLGAGMTTRQAWNKIATRYTDERKKNRAMQNPVFDEVLLMNRRFLEGESEGVVYGKFEQEIDAPCYRKLMQMLLNSSQKGTKGVCEALETECDNAYEQRILRAKKMGEEASTRMLLPLMIMMLVVMAIVITPALIGFSI